MFRDVRRCRDAQLVELQSFVLVTGIGQRRQGRSVTLWFGAFAEFCFRLLESWMTFDIVLYICSRYLD